MQVLFNKTQSLIEKLPPSVQQTLIDLGYNDPGDLYLAGGFALTLIVLGCIRWPIFFKRALLAFLSFVALVSAITVVRENLPEAVAAEITMSLGDPESTNS